LSGTSTTAGDDQQIGETLGRRRHDRRATTTAAPDSCAGENGSSATYSDGEGLTTLGRQNCFDQGSIPTRSGDILAAASAATSDFDSHLGHVIGNRPGVLSARVFWIEKELFPTGVCKCRGSRDNQRRDCRSPDQQSAPLQGWA